MFMYCGFLVKIMLEKTSKLFWWPTNSAIDRDYEKKTLIVSPCQGLIYMHAYIKRLGGLGWGHHPHANSCCNKLWILTLNTNVDCWFKMEQQSFSATLWFTICWSIYKVVFHWVKSRPFFSKIKDKIHKTPVSIQWTELQWWHYCWLDVTMMDLSITKLLACFRHTRTN